ncbi:MAG: polysaccharide deacetylase family protein [Muribaculaceae bacterium]|nr:polysaccharide deacetylase family protein [Muribaculaceae bacterium]
MLIERPPRWYRCLFPGAIFRKEEKGDGCRRIYLTFDDGPIPVITPWVLDVLDDFGVKATFFMVGQNIERHPELLSEVLKRGHRVGNHTLHHIRGLGIKAEDYLLDVNGCHRLTKSDLFRPPHGWLTPAQLRAVKKEFTIVMYDLVTRDYSKRVPTEGVIRNVKKYTRPGSIIVFHDSLKSHEKLKRALPESLKWLLEQGYAFEVL